MKPSMRTIIAGSRVATKRDVWEALCACPWTADISVVLSGCARGADLHGESWAAWRGVPVERYPADWSTHGRRAGPIRNAKMVSNAQALLAVWDGNSSGTRHVIGEANRSGLRVFVWRIR